MPGTDRQTVTFGSGGEGVLFLPAGDARVGAVIILHERYGLVQHTLDLAQKLADDGYLALAPNLFAGWPGDQEALKRGQVRVVLPDPEVGGQINHGIDFLKRHPRVEPSRITLMGVCQSGRYPMVVGSERDDLAACVVFYGASQGRDWEVTELQPRGMREMITGLRPPGLFIFGEADHTISIEDVRRVREALEEGGRSYRMRVFAGMPHGWLNDTMPGRYRPAEAEEAWALLLDFLEDVATRRWPGPGRVRWEFHSDIATDYDFTRNVRLE